MAVHSEGIYFSPVNDNISHLGYGAYHALKDALHEAGEYESWFNRSGCQF